jgi:surfactin synthase thioesterase subunit
VGGAGLYGVDLTVVAIPFAGADRYCYRVLQTASPSNWKWVVLDLPGRGPRGKEQRLLAITEMVEDLHQSLRQQLPKGPYVVLGHSMGAILAYELMRLLGARGMALPFGALLSSIAAPGVPRTRFVSHLPSTEFWDVMRSYNGVPEGIASNPALRDYFEPVLRADFAAIERYRPQGGVVEALPLQLALRWGNTEKLEDADMKQWSQASSLEVDFKQHPGGHFYLFNTPELVIADLVKLALRQ